MRRFPICVLSTRRRARPDTFRTALQGLKIIFSAERKTSAGLRLRGAPGFETQGVPPGLALGLLPGAYRRALQAANPSNT